MKPKLVSFKFTKKHQENKGKIKSAKKNYENIFNDILSGTRPEKKSMPVTKRENQGEKSIIANKKNKIKYILKLETINLQDDMNIISKNKTLTEESEKNNHREHVRNIKDKIEINNVKDINVNDSKYSFKEQNFIDDYLMNKSIDKKIKKSKIENKEKLQTEANKSAEKEIIRLLNKKNKEKILDDTDKQSNYIKCIKTMKNKTNLNIKKKKTNIIKNKEEYLYKNNSINSNKLNNKSFRQNTNRNKERKLETKLGERNYKSKKFGKKLFAQKTNNITYNTKNDRINNNTVDKIKIANNDENKEINCKDFISINDNIKKKRLILNNTNSNINININITNINDKNIKKEIRDDSKRKKAHFNAENNYKSNITTVNIINNNNISKKISSNDYRLLFYNYSNKRNLPHQTKINHQGIKIESIDINLSEEGQNPVIQKHKYKFKKNLKKNNYFQNYKNYLENNDKEARSEYEHFFDREDYLSNKSSTSYSCKSGFTVTRKLRSLNRERDKIKMMNNLKNSEKNNIDKIEDKLINIVNKFHKDNSMNKINKKRRSSNILKLGPKNFDINK